MNSKGIKRFCIKCGNPFYDLNKKPIPTKCYNHRSIIKEEIIPNLKEKYKILSAGYYIPQRFRSNANINDLHHSVRIMNGLKECKTDDLNYFTEYLNNIIFSDYDEGLVICCVPSSRAYYFESGIHKIINQICKIRNFINGSDYLIRTENIPKKHLQSGYRTKEIDYKTIKLKDSKILTGKKVLLIDDITTTGNSIYACRDKIVEDKPLSIEFFTFGITKNEF